MDEIRKSQSLSLLEAPNWRLLKDLSLVLTRGLSILRHFPPALEPRAGTREQDFRSLFLKVSMRCCGAGGLTPGTQEADPAPSNKLLER